MDIPKLLQDLFNGESAAAQKVVDLVTDKDAEAIAAHQFDENPEQYPNTDAGKKKLADDTFGAIKHFLRGKIQAAVDVAFLLSDVRKPLREKANAAAAKELASVNI